MLSRKADRNVRGRCLPASTQSGEKERLLFGEAFILNVNVCFYAQTWEHALAVQSTCVKSVPTSFECPQTAVTPTRSASPGEVNRVPSFPASASS